MSQSRDNRELLIKKWRQKVSSNDVLLVTVSAQIVLKQKRAYTLVPKTFRRYDVVIYMRAYANKVRRKSIQEMRKTGSRPATSTVLPTWSLMAFLK